MSDDAQPAPLRSVDDGVEGAAIAANTDGDTDAGGTPALAAERRRVRGTQLKGHTGTVNCLAINNRGVHATQLASAGEDSTVRIWDLAAGLPKSVRRISDVFGGDAVTSVDYQPSGRHYLFATTESSLYAFDLRKTKEILLRESVFQKQGFGEEELSQVCACPADPRYVAVSDDSGRVSVINVAKSHGPVVMSWQHKLMCGGLAFHPLHKDTFASAGMMERDVRLWSVASRSSVSRVIVPAGEDLAAELAAIRVGSGGAAAAGQPGGGGPFASAESPSQMMNPPFVQSLHFSHDGRYLASAGGDGSVHVFAANTGKLAGPVAAFAAHNAPLSQVHFASWGAWTSTADGDSAGGAAEPGEGDNNGGGDGGGGGGRAMGGGGGSGGRKKGKGKKKKRGKGGGRQQAGRGASSSTAAAAAAQRHSADNITMVTASTDCTVKLWRVQPQRATAALRAGAAAVQAAAAAGASAATTTDTAAAPATDASSSVDAAAAPSTEEPPPCHCVLRVRHGAKMNWLVSNISRTGEHALFVADVSPDITMYTNLQ